LSHSADDVYYDDLGRVKQASLPYFEDEKKYFVTTEYDAIDRVISTTKLKHCLFWHQRFWFQNALKHW
jgi:hypothetical protein